ncbi:MAG: O-antigen ligase family protein [Lachnospiraceae bacterium]|nr:O-antigen ligase family protein [Lachnospiraceae bacterium]
MIEKCKKAINEKNIVFLAAVVGSLHLFASVFQYFFAFHKYIFDFAEQLVLDVLGILVALFLVSAVRSKECKQIKSYFSKEQILLGAVFVALFLSCLLNQLWNGAQLITNNSKYLFDTFVCVFILFPLGRRLAVCKKRSKGLKLIWDCLLFFLAAVMAFVLINVFQGRVLHTVLNGGIGMLIFNETLQLSINCHPNTVGAYSGLLFLICISLSVSSGGFRRGLYIVESLIHFVVLALSNSRGAFFSMLCIAASMAGLTVYYSVRGKAKWGKWLAAILSGLLIFLILFFMRNAVFTLYARISPPKTTVVNDSGKTVQQDEVIRKLNVTSVNGRQRIWECTIRLITGNPRNALVGVTPYRIASILGSMLQWEIDVYTHNQILEVGADTGIPAMLIFLVFLLLLAGKSLKLGFAPSKAEEWKQKLPLLILLFLIIANVMEATLLFYGYLSGGVFMLLCGWICERYVRFRISKKMISGED